MMEVDIERKNNILVIVPQGRIDSDSCGEFGECISSRINDEDKSIIFDLTNLDYISSAGLRVLLKMFKLMDEYL